MTKNYSKVWETRCYQDVQKAKMFVGWTYGIGFMKLM